MATHRALHVLDVLGRGRGRSIPRPRAGLLVSLTALATASLAPSRTATAADAVLPAGTKMLVQTTSPIDSNRMSDGAKFTVALQSSLAVGDTVLVPDGSTVYGVLADAKPNAAGDHLRYLERLYDLRSYALPTPGELVDFMSRARIERDTSYIVAAGQGVLHPDDSVQMTIRQSDQQIERVAISGKLDSDPFTAKIDDRPQADAGYQPVRALIEIPSRDIDITIENFAYERQ